MYSVHRGVYLLYEVPGVRAEGGWGTLEALDPLYGVVYGEQQLEHRVTCTRVTVSLRRLAAVASTTHYLTYLIRRLNM